MLSVALPVFEAVSERVRVWWWRIWERVIGNRLVGNGLGMTGEGRGSRKLDRALGQWSV